MKNLRKIKNVPNYREINCLNKKLIFEGEYKNGERNGKGKEYNKNGNLIFEGEYLNGKRNGKGKEYDFNGNIIFEGKYLNGKKWTGKGYKRNNIIYELKDGKGFINSEEFKGEYINGERNGQGKEYDEYGKLIFEGEYLNGERNGQGKEYDWFSDKLMFEGEYLNNKRV